ncbi:polysaccharide deacetylase family protein [Novipirellula artificiosorum]|uniref:Polysaccharide deacetylase n=1 Tax=Novipirellula artificiosorum TaxID=2528016 RepID=A0A5C6DJ69_9BACT|nr:hypothetical protein [Novipirellula artificiosorum]TWU34949.1 hypothetical protein Poly41_40930 [Novipirellula artificiosorum]
MNDSVVVPVEKGPAVLPPIRFAFGGPVGDLLNEHLGRDADQAHLSATFKLYYRLRGFIPIPVRQWLQRGRNQSIEVPPSWYLPTEFLDDFRAAIATEPDGGVIHPWPDGFRMAAAMTHDVETKQGMAKVDRLAAMEEKVGIRSSWNLVPYKYKVDLGFVRDLQQRGHEIGVQGYNHDGRLYESRRMFDRRSGPINDAIAKYGSVGFRSPMVHRNLEWLQGLDIDYDASCFDVDPFQAMPGGVGGVWPFIAGKFVELPYTLPQDHTLLVSLGETTPGIWIKKFQFLRELAGMAMLITHPDYLDSPQRIDVYRQFLDFLAEQSDCWTVLPREITAWWRIRDKMSLVDDGAALHLSGESSERARCMPISELFTARP